MIPEYTILLSVSHTGTRELARQLGIELLYHPRTGLPHLELTDKVWHTHHTIPVFFDSLVVPARSPYRVLVSYAKRGKGPEVLEQRVCQMDLYLKNYPSTIVPVDIPGVRDERLGELGVVAHDWQKTGEIPGTVDLPQEYLDLIPWLREQRLFKDYA
jgi:hypothetical protein